MRVSKGGEQCSDENETLRRAKIPDRQAEIERAPDRGTGCGNYKEATDSGGGGWGWRAQTEIRTEP